MARYTVASMIIFSVLLSSSYIAAKDIPYTLDDRDMLIRVEEGLKEGLKEGLTGVNQRIDSLEKRVDGLQGLMYVVIGTIIAQSLAVMGFSLWDKRTFYHLLLIKQMN